MTIWTRIMKQTAPSQNYEIDVAWITYTKFLRKRLQYVQHYKYLFNILTVLKTKVINAFYNALLSLPW